MAEEKGSGFSVPWQAVLTLAAIVSVYFLLPPINSLRPGGAPGPSSGGLGAQDADARLWEDPVKAVARHQAALASMSERAPQDEIAASAWKARLAAERHLHDADTLKKSLSQYWNSGQKVLVMPVMIQGGIYSEDSEARLRARHAVLSALTQASMLPESGEQLGYVTLDWPRLATDRDTLAVPTTRPDAAEPLTVPYEWWILAGNPRSAPTAPATRGVSTQSVQSQISQTKARVMAVTTPGAPPVRTDVKYQRVLVLWLEDSAFADYPLRRLARLVQAVVGPELKPTGQSDASAISIAGPRGSGTLRAMLQELLTADAGLPSTARERLRNVHIYSPTATVDDDLLLNGLVPETDRSRSVELTFATKLPETRFERTIPTDGILALALVNELARRGISSHRDHIALVSEWDTQYGRSFRYSFLSAWGKRKDGDDPDDPTTAVERDVAAWTYERDAKLPRNIKFANYFRGIDGQVPGESTTGGGDGSRKASKSETGSEGAKGSSAAQELSLGTNQSDYIRRLADELQEWDQQSRYEGHGLKAIGIIGSDVYDKLMVLQALRPKFPRAVFFTTDLDARVTQAGDHAGTQNLVIASAFGLSLKRDFQGDVTPFRDSYQTSLFATTLKMLKLLKPSPARASPRLYEIGRSGPCDLSLYNSAAEQDLLGETTLHPEPSWGQKVVPIDPFRRAFLVVLSIVFSILLLGLISVKARRADALKPRRRIWPYAAHFCVTLIVGVAIYAFHEREQGEPWAWMDGISIWPTELIRWVVTLFSVAFLVRASDRLREIDARIQEEFNLRSELEGAARWSREWWAERRRAMIAAWSFPLAGATMDDLWNGFWLLGLRRNRWARVLPQVGACWILVVGLIWGLGDPWVPYRGRTAYYADRFMEWATLLCVLTLILYLADDIRLCIRLARAIRAATWNDRSVRKCAKTLGAQPADVPELMDIELLAIRTSVTSTLVFLPFLLIVMLMLSRLSYFDNWDWPPGLIAVAALQSAFILWIGLKMRRFAIEAREEALKKLQARIDQSDEQQQRERLQRIAERIRSEDRGAFSTASQHPFLSSVLVPSGGVGIWALLEYLAKVK